MGPFLFLYTALVGFFAFAAIYHLILWRFSRRELLLLLFGADCAIRAAFSGVLTQIASSATPEEAHAALRARIALGMMMMTTWLWSLSLLSGVRARWFLWPITLFFAVVIPIHVLVFPLNSTVVAVDRIALPWGEMVSSPVMEPPGWWFGPLYVLVYAIEIFGAVCAWRLWKRDRIAGALLAVAIGGMFLVHSLEIWRSFGKVPVPFIGVIPMIVWVCVVALLIARGHRQTRDQLAASEQRFRGIFDQTFQFIGLLATDGTLLQANRTALAFAGIREGDVIGRPFWETPWWSHSTELQSKLKQAIRAAASGETVRFEVTHPSPDGGIAHVDFSLKPIRNERGEVTLLIPEGRDITQRKRAKDALQTSNARTQAILNALPDLMFRLDEAGTILDYYASRADELYVPPESFLGQRMQDVLPDGIGSLFLGHLRKTFDTRDSQLFEYELEIPGKGPMSFEARMVVCGEHEAVTIVRNITERKRAEDNKRALEAQLTQAQKMEAVGLLAGGIAHDFNNLLTVINGLSELIQARTPTDDARHGMLGGILDAGLRAASLTRQLLTFTRQQVVEPRILDLNAVVAETESMLKRLIGEDVILRTVLHSSLARVSADPGQIGQVIMNLAVNARDAMPTGGELVIETDNVESGGKYVRLAITDSGCGMTPEIRARIFEPFYTTKLPGKGTGLGLATVRTIAEESGGFLRVTSEPGLGSTFALYLPAIDSTAQIDLPEPGAKPPLRGTETVLLVEDDDAVRSLTVLILQQFGYSVVEASGGAEAILLCEQHRGTLDLLVTDVVMPEIGGPELVEKLRRIHGALKVLYLSGYTDDAVVRHGVLQSEVAFLQKPFSMEALASKVRQTLDAPAI